MTKKDDNNFNSIEEAIGDEFKVEVEIGDKLCLLAQVKLVRYPAKYWAQRLKEAIDVTYIYNHNKFKIKNDLKNKFRRRRICGRNC